MIIQQFCYNACFENRFYPNAIDMLGNNLSITEISLLLMYNFIHGKHYVNSENHTQLSPAGENTQIAHSSNIYMLPQFTTCYKPQPSTSDVRTFHLISGNFPVSSFFHFAVTHETQHFLHALPQDNFRSVAKQGAIFIILTLCFSSHFYQVSNFFF